MAEAHVRIDEGIKRGPRKPSRKLPKATRIVKVDPKELEQGKLANLNVTTVLERYMAGETSSQIALDYNVTRQGLAWWMRKHAEEDWREAQIIQAVERKEQAEDEMNTAQDALSLARTREQLRSAQWDLERLFSRLYGQKQEITHTIQPVLSITIVSNTPNTALQSPDSHKPITIDAVQVPDTK